MTVLEKAVTNLAEALEALETRLDERLDAETAGREALTALRGQAAAAARHTKEASQGIAAAVSDVTALLARDDEAEEQN